MSIIQFSALALRAKIHKDGTETERILANLLFDEALQVLSSFEMNQIASFSYGDEPCEQIFDLLAEVMAHPMEFSVLAVQKSLVITKHLLIYGSEKCVNSCWGLGSYVEKLCEFNTVLLTQQQQGLGSWWTSVKGGAVDKGFPVRESAQDLRKILADASRIQQLRNDHADPNSLVPVGSKDKLAFASDEVRHFMLQKRMKEQGLLLTRSNLKKDVGGFGSGYNSANGQTVVGAAHSLEEMLERAQREERKFSDTGPVHFKPKPAQPKEEQTQEVVVDLLDFNAPVKAPAVKTAPVVDLLGFGGVDSTPAPVLDVFAPGPAIHEDLLGVGGGMNSGTHELQSNLLVTPQADVREASDLMNLMALSEQTTHKGDVNTTFSVVESMPGFQSTQTAAPTLTTAAMMSDGKQNVMASNSDRFSALDELAQLHGPLQDVSSIPVQSQPFPSSLVTSIPPPLPTPSLQSPFLGTVDMSSAGHSMEGSVSSAPRYPFPMQAPPTTLNEEPDVMPMGGKALSFESAGGLASHGAFLSHPLPPLQMNQPSTPFESGFGIPTAYPPPFCPPPPPPSDLPPPPPPDVPSTLTLAPRFGNVDDEDSGFYMGGGSGAGL